MRSFDEFLNFLSVFYKDVLTYFALRTHVRVHIILSTTLLLHGLVRAKW